MNCMIGNNNVFYMSFERAIYAAKIDSLESSKSSNGVEEISPKAQGHVNFD